MADSVIYPLVELSTVAAEVVLIILYCNRLNIKPQISTGRVVACYILFSLPLALISFFSVTPILRIGYSFFALACLCRFCYRVDWPNGIYLTAVFLILSLVSDILCSYCFEAMGIENSGLSGSALDRLAFNAVAKLAHLILIQLVPFLIRRKQTQLSFAGAIPMITAQIASFLICLCLHLADGLSGELSGWTIFGVVATLYVNIVICFYIEAVSAKNDLEREKELLEREYLSSLKYYSTVKQSQEETRALWHEIKKYLNTIHALVDCGDNRAAVACMDEAERLFGELTVHVDVGNPVISSILSIGLQQAKQNHIPFSVDVWVCEELGVAAQDLFIILGNAIDNAIEECTQLPEPYIHVSIHQKEQLLVIRIENPCRPQGTPKPGKIHGYGLKNVKRCVEKYDGALQTTIQNGTFRFFVLLNIAAAIMERPDILILDEPINALDENGVVQICELIKDERDRGALIIMACHDAQILEAMADKIYSICEGKLKEKNASELL